MVLILPTNFYGFVPKSWKVFSLYLPVKHFVNVTRFKIIRTEIKDDRYQGLILLPPFQKTLEENQFRADIWHFQSKVNKN
jgi:hypothetical protein